MNFVGRVDESIDADPADQPLLSIQPVDDNPLPTAAEQFVRGNRIFVNYPQANGNYAIRLALEVIEATANGLVVEASLSIQTDLLDSHPMLDLVVQGKRIDRFDPPEQESDWHAPLVSSTRGARPLTVAQRESYRTAILLGPHDAPFTTDCSDQERMRLRLFGDFLEKGVIRTARPWIVLDQTGQTESLDRLLRLHRQLCGRPLPLSS